MKIHVVLIILLSVVLSSCVSDPRWLTAEDYDYMKPDGPVFDLESPAKWGRYI